MEMLLRARHLTKRYEKFVALDDVSFDVTKGEIVAVVGPNGAGKTTLVNTLAGLFRLDAGDVVFEGRSIAELGPAARARRGLARSFQLVSVFPTLTVSEMIAVGVLARHRKSFRFFRSAARFQPEIAEILEAFSLSDRSDVRCAALPQGEKKLIDIASALSLRPRLLLLDEPTSGIASADKHQIMDRLLAATVRLGVESLVLVEHDMELISRYATRVIGLRSGSIVADLSPREFFEDPRVIDSIVGKVPQHARH